MIRLLRRLVPGAALLLAAASGARQADLRFSDRLIANGFSYPYAVAAGDLDRDGDLDLTVSDCTTRGSRDHNDIAWFENDGAGAFRRHAVWKEDRAGRFERHRIGDIDGDGWPDLAIVDNDHDSVFWFGNNRTPAADALWSRHVIAEGTVHYAYDVELGDLDGDGDLDAAAIAGWRTGQEIVWFENPGGKRAASGPWTRRVIDAGMLDPRTVRASDVDLDGDLDLFTTWARQGLVVWYENPGTPRAGAAWRRHRIDTAGRPIHGEAADMDGDGDPDLVLALGMGAGLVPSEITPVAHQVVWYENDGKGTTWRKHLVADGFEQAFEAIATDLDGDGFRDVVASAWGRAGRLAWFRNPGKSGGRWRSQMLRSPWPNAVQVISADLDRDRRPDVVAVAEHDSYELRWWRNLGAPPRP